MHYIFIFKHRCKPCMGAGTDHLSRQRPEPAADGQDKFAAIPGRKKRPVLIPCRHRQPPSPFLHQPAGASPGSVVRGGAGGAALGAAVGGIAGGWSGAGKGAAIGGLTGGVFGGLRSRARNQQAAQAQQQYAAQQSAQYRQKKETYNRAYSVCLEAKGIYGQIMSFLSSWRFP
jgi:hypothetical protein